MSDRTQDIVIVVDLLRPEYGALSDTSLALEVNGEIQESTRRLIVEKGQYLLKGIVFTPSKKLQPTDKIGYHFETAGNIEVFFTAIIVGVPSNCEWDLR